MKQIIVPLIVQEDQGISRTNEPVTFGVPLKQGQVFESMSLVIHDSDGNRIPAQYQPLSEWRDGSIKWLLLDFQVTISANQTRQFELLKNASSSESVESYQGIVLQEGSEEIIVETGAATFYLNTQTFKPFNHVVVESHQVVEESGSSVQLTESGDQVHEPKIDRIHFETRGSVRTTILFQGHISLAQTPGSLEFDARVTFFRNRSVAEVKFVLRNPHAAQHPDGLWDLGDNGSIYFQDLSLHIPLGKSKGSHAAWKSTCSQPWEEGTCSKLHIYQDSSGGKNWQSQNHVNRYGKVMHSFSGFQVVQEGDCIHRGDRATPMLYLQGAQGSVVGVIEKFWQDFPKALAIDRESLILHLFPQHYNDEFELQGGEQKTHTVYVQFSASQTNAAQIESLEWAHHRLVPHAPIEWYVESNAIPFFAPQVQRREDSEYDRAMSQADDLVEGVIAGPNSFFERREIIDEFGWRHFGDLYANHEAIHSKGEQPLVAHYNNQYDVVYGGIVQFLRTGKMKWYVLAQDLAKHVIDIDIYHTSQDRPVYNGGLFWHTDHYCDAATATHRAFSKGNLGTRAAHEYGGGPSNEHDFACGLLHYFYLTGEYAAAEAVQTLADWVLAMDDGSSSKFGWIDRRPTGQCSSTADRYYHGPGRGSGFSVSTLLDAFQLTNEPKYGRKVEELIQRCIHPKDDIAARGLDNIEAKWSYLVFLQVLGKYLCMKEERREFDYLFHYARESLFHYVKWMLEQELPYKQLLHKVCLPTETWPAQDIRKSYVFGVAAQYAVGPFRDVLNQKRLFFLEACIRDLLSFNTCTLTRPLAILMTNVYVQDFFHSASEKDSPSIDTGPHNFGNPVGFIPQLNELLKLRGVIHKLLSRGRNLLSVFRRPGTSREGKGGSV